MALHPCGNGGAESNGMPWWVKAAGVVGVPSLIAVFLVYALASGHQATTDDIAKDVKAHAEASELHTSDSKAALDRIERIFRVMCVNAAADSMQRERCLAP